MSSKMKILEKVEDWLFKRRVGMVTETIVFTDAERPMKPLVTEFDDVEVEPVIRDVEGSLWTLKRAGDLIYLSGEDGEVQAQFPRDKFLTWVDRAERVATD